MNSPHSHTVHVCLKVTGFATVAAKERELCWEVLHLGIKTKAIFWIPLSPIGERRTLIQNLFLNQS